eukprot:457282-Heterocapsa_arctica.AAC.1
MGQPHSRRVRRRAVRTRRLNHRQRDRHRGRHQGGDQVRQRQAVSVRPSWLGEDPRQVRRRLGASGENPPVVVDPVRRREH